MNEERRARPAEPSRPFYGWVIVGVTFVTQFVATGWIFYSLPMALTSLADEFAEGQRLPISILLPLMSLSGMALAPVMGRLIGRGYLRAIMVLAALSAGLSLLLVASAESLWQIGVVYATLVAFGMGGLTNLTCAVLVTNWFESKRALALGISQLGASLGGAVMAPVVALLIVELGWRGMYQVLGISALCITPVVWYLVVQRPEDRGLRPDGAGPDMSQPEVLPAATGSIAGLGETLRDANFWLIAIATGLGFLATGSVIQHIAAFGTDAGFSASRAALLASILSGAAAAGKLVFGWLCDRSGEINAYVTALIGYALGLGLMTQLTGYELVAGCCVLVGVSFGGLLPVSTALMARAFGREQMGPKMGVALPIITGLQLPGPLAMALVFDITGSYDGGYWTLTALLVLAAFLVLQIRLSPAPSGSLA